MKPRKRTRHPNQRAIVYGTGKRFEELPAGATAHGTENIPGRTVGELPDGRPRPLDYRNFDHVDWSAFEEIEQ